MDTEVQNYGELFQQRCRLSDHQAAIHEFAKPRSVCSLSAGLCTDTAQTIML